MINVYDNIPIYDEVFNQLYLVAWKEAGDLLIVIKEKIN